LQCQYSREWVYFHTLIISLKKGAGHPTPALHIKISVTD
jgi:hypothetical protein